MQQVLWNYVGLGMKKYDVYGIGQAIVDIEFEVSEAEVKAQGVEKGIRELIARDDQKKLLENLRASCGEPTQISGGSGVNSIVAASYFGSQCYLTTRVATDTSGRFYTAEMGAAGIDSHLDSLELEGSTGKCLVMVTPDAERTMFTYVGISEGIDTTDIDWDALKASRYLFLEGFLCTTEATTQAIPKVVRFAKAHDVKVAVSFSDPCILEYFKSNIAGVIQGGVDLLFCNREEALLWAVSQSLEEAIESLKVIANNFCVTDGANGAYIFDGQLLHHVPAHKTEIVDTLGAGDMFAGAFLYAISQGQSLVKAGTFASFAASFVIAQMGARLKPSEYAYIQKAFLELDYA